MTAQRERDRQASRYDPAENDYRLADDPRCLYGWGPPACRCQFGHACFRAFGHPGRCWDAGDAPSTRGNPLDCDTAKRPKDWDTNGRAAPTDD
jgi:hypothetical protein